MISKHALKMRGLLLPTSDPVIERWSSERFAQNADEDALPQAIDLINPVKPRFLRQALAVFPSI